MTSALPTDDRRHRRWVPVVAAASVLAMALGVALVVAAGDDGSAPSGRSPSGTQTIGGGEVVMADADDCPANSVLGRHVPSGAPRVGAARAVMCGSQYTGAIGNLAPPREAVSDVDSLVRRLDALPKARQLACSDVGGVQPVWLVFHHDDGSFDALVQHDCGYFEYAGDPRAGSLSHEFADVVREQRTASGPPTVEPEQPTCEWLDGHAPQSLLGDVDAIVVATLCVVPDGGSGGDAVSDEVPVPEADLRVLLADLATYGEPADGFSLNTSCADPSTEVDLVGATAWGDLVTLHAPFCRDFYNHDVVWTPGDESMAVLDTLIGADVAR